MSETKIEDLLEDTPIIGKELKKERKTGIIGYLKQKRDWIIYSILAFITFLGVYIRTLNISKLKDVTTGTWTLGPDLDPFLFLRWAKYIVEHGSLMVIDTMRNVPLGYNTASEMKLLSYIIAWLFKFMSFFYKEVTVTYAAIWFPVIMFALTTIAFFLFARKIFYKESKKIRNIIALIATTFFIVIPSLLPRTIAGIPEKEPAGFFFMFMAFYLFLESITSEKITRGLIFGGLAGIFTGLLALIWGGVSFVFMTIAGAILFAFLIGKINKKRFYFFSLWMLAFLITMVPFSTRYSFNNLITSISTTLVFMVFFILLIDFILFKINIFNFRDKIKIKLPKPIVSMVLAGIDQPLQNLSSYPFLMLFYCLKVLNLSF